MVTVIKKGSPLNEQIRKLNEAVSKVSKGISTEKYRGALIAKIDPIEFQQKMRDDWK